MNIAKENHFDQFYLECLEGAYLATKTTHPERALGYLEESVTMRDSIYNEDQQALIRDYQVKYQMATDITTAMVWNSHCLQDTVLMVIRQLLSAQAC